MNVLMLGWEFPPHITGGLGAACRSLANGLADSGTRVTFVAPRVEYSADGGSQGVELVSAGRIPPRRLRLGYRTWQSQRPSDSSLELLTLDSPLRPYDRDPTYAQRLSEVARAVRRQTQRPVPVVRPALVESEELDSPRPFEGGYGASLHSEVERYARVVAQLARGRRFDLVHAHDWMTWPAALRVRELTGIPIVLHVHSTEFDRGAGRPDARIRALEELALRSADRVVCVSRYTANIVRRQYGVSRVEVVHNEVPDLPQGPAERPAQAAEAPMLTGDAPLVLWIGRLTQQKGPGHFLSAAQLVHAFDPSVRFALCGEGELREELERRVFELGLGDCVALPGFLEPDELRRLLKRADVHVMPSVSEPFGLVALEAAAADVPVILSRQSGVAEVLRSSLCVDFWDTRALADKILAVLRRPSLRAELVGGAHADLASLRRGSSTPTLLQVYRSLRTDSCAAGTRV